MHEPVTHPDPTDRDPTNRPSVTAYRRPRSVLYRHSDPEPKSGLSPCSPVEEREEGLYEQGVQDHDEVPTEAAECRPLSLCHRHFFSTEPPSYPTTRKFDEAK